MYPSSQISLGQGTRVKDIIIRVRPKIVTIPALSGIIAPLLMISLWAIASLLRPGYDQLTQYGSELGTGDNSIIMNTNFIVTGLLIVSFSLGLLTSIRTGFWSSAGSIFVGLFGIGEIATAAFPCDPGCPLTNPQSLYQQVHNGIAAVAFTAIAIAPLLVSVQLKRDKSWRNYQAYSLGTGFAALGLFIAFSIAALYSLLYVGLLQRLFLAFPFLWIELMAIHLLAISKRRGT